MISKHDAIREADKLGILDETAHFQCYEDSIFTYHCNGIEINIISEDTFFRDMKVKDLINLERIIFFDINRKIIYRLNENLN